MEHVFKREPIVGPSIWDGNLCVELAELHFTYIHDQFLSLFHRPSSMQDLRHGKAPKGDRICHDGLVGKAFLCFNAKNLIS